MKNILLLLLFLFGNSLFAQNEIVKIQSTSDNFINLKIANSGKNNIAIAIKKANVNSKNIKLENKLIENPEFKITSDLNSPEIVYFSKKSADLSITNLNPETDYTLDVYSVSDLNKITTVFIKSYDFFTLAKEPTKQASAIAFKNTSHNKIGLLWKNGDGKECIIVAKKGSKVDFPVDGIEYNASLVFGDSKAKLGNTESFVVFKGKFDKTKEYDVTNLEFENYYFHIFEYNGTGKYTNYNTKPGQNNPRNKHTTMIPPVANSISMENGHIKATWTKVKTAESYLIDLSYDPNFRNMVETYDTADVGDTQEIEMVLPENKQVNEVYFRVRAFNDKYNSLYSNVLKLEIKK